jgi:hypothetical protein
VRLYFSKDEPSCSNLSSHFASAAAPLWYWDYCCSQAPGLSAEDMERYYTIPTEIGLYTTPGIDVIRSTSFYGLSFVRVSFKYGVDYNFAYAQASVAMQQNVSLPGGQVPNIQANSSTGEIYRYQVVGPKHFGITNLRTVQDWIVARRLLTIPGIAGRQQLGRSYQGISGRGRPAQAGSLQRHYSSNPDRAGQCERQRGRTRNSHRPAVRQHPRCRLD